VVHKGDLYAFRSFLYGNDLNVAVWVERAARLPHGDTAIFTFHRIMW
jgi:hypothetical protein